MRIKEYTIFSNQKRGKLCLLRCILFVVVMLVATTNTFAQAHFEIIDGLRYLIDENVQTATLVANPDRIYSGDIVVPEKVQTKYEMDYPVVALGESCFSGCSGLTSITIPSSVISLGRYCLSCCNLESIYFDGKLPNNTIESSIPTYCIFYVPKNYLQDYKDALGSKYQYIYARTDEGGDDKPTTQCDAPSITYNDGKLHFFSSTPGAEYHYTITDSDLANDVYSQEGIVKLSAVYQVSAYATADGYQASDKATATLYWINANFENNPSSNINQVNTRGIVVTSQSGIVTLSGLSNGEVVRFFAPDGKQVGSTKAVNGIASCAVGGSMIIVKVGGQSLKLMVE